MDKISRDLKNFILANFPLFNGTFLANEMENNLRRDNWLQLSSSNLSLSLTSNSENNNDDENSNSNSNNINISNNSITTTIRLSRERSIFEDDVFDHIPCI